MMRRNSSNNPSFALGRWLSLSLVMALALPIYAWATAQSSPFSIGGLLPTSDALGFAFSGLHLLYDGTLDVTGTRRPLAGLYAAGRLLFGGQSLQGSVLFQAVLLGCAGGFFAREVCRTHGVAAALISLSLCLFAAFPSVAASLSDAGGIIFGLVGLSCMWRAVADGRSPLGYALGGLMLTFGLAIRPGDFILLPLGAVFAYFLFPDDRRRAVVGYVLAAACGVLTVAATAGWLGHPKGMPQANFYYTLYGMSVGQDWAAPFRDIADLATRLETAGEREVALSVRDMALHNIMANPWPMIGRMADNVAGWLSSTPLVGFLGHADPRTGLTALLFAAALWSFRRSPLDRLVCLGLISTFLSAGVSYGDGGWKAALTASPFWAAAVGLTAVGLWRTIRPDAGFDADRPGRPSPGGGLPVFAALLTATTIVLPAAVIATGFLRPKPPLAQAACAPGGDGAGSGGIIMRAGFPLASLHIGEEAGGGFSPYLSGEKFRAALRGSGNEWAGLLGDVPPNHVITYAYDLTDDPVGLKPLMRLVVVVASERDAALPYGRYAALCGKIAPATPWATGPRIITGATAKVLD